jgi:hypothetical protein
MRTNPYLAMVMVPAALVAQTPAVPDFMAIQKQEGAVIEGLLKEFRPLEALAKGEAALPASLPAFDKSNPSVALKTSISFSGLTRLYLLTANAAAQAGEWEKFLDLCAKAQACAKANMDGTTEALTPIIATWTNALEQAKKAVADGADRVAAIKAKPGRTPAEETEYQAWLAKEKVYNTTKSVPEKNEAAKFLTANLKRFKDLDAKSITAQDQQELAAYKVSQDNLVNGPKTIKTLQENIDATKAEYDLCGPKIEATRKNIADEAEEINKGVAETKVKGKVVKETSGPKYDEKRATYFENVLKTKANLESRPTKIDKMNYLFRLRHNVAGTPLMSKVDEVIERVRADQDPFPPAPKATKGKKAK